MTKSEIFVINVNTIVEFCDTTFFEDVFPMKTGIPQNISSVDFITTIGSIPNHVERMTTVGIDPSGGTSGFEQSEKINEPRRSKRTKISKDLGSDFVTYNVKDNPTTTFKQALSSPKAKHSKEAVNSEIQSIVSNETRELVELSPGCSTNGCK